MPDRRSVTLPTIPAHGARRMMLAAQGLLADPSRRAGAAALRHLVEQLGYVQVDTISVIERAHHLTLLSRLDHYRPAMLTTLLEKQRHLFEHWTHDASVIPTRWFAHWKHRFKRYQRRDPKHGWWRERLGPRPRAMIAEVLKRIDANGPMMSRDFERPKSPAPAANEAWWQWRPEKAALEYLWRSGELTVTGRRNFQKIYDLTSRVFPDLHASPPSSIDEHVDWACSTALERLGAATPTELAAFWRAIDRAQAGRWCRESIRSGRIVEVLVESADGSPARPGVAFADWEVRLATAMTPEAHGRRMRLLCPFDPVLRDRDRARRLFNFDYTFEAFVPAAKRRYGYYVLPILEGDQLIGRLDAKTHRERDELEVKGLWWEPKVRATKTRNAALKEALERLAAFVGVQRIALRAETGVT